MQNGFEYIWTKRIVPYNISFIDLDPDTFGEIFASWLALTLLIRVTWLIFPGSFAENNS